MDDDVMMWLWVGAGAVVALVALYVVIRLAVSHAMRERILWQHDGGMDRELRASAAEQAFHARGDDS